MFRKKIVQKFVLSAALAATLAAHALVPATFAQMPILEQDKAYLPLIGTGVALGSGPEIPGPTLARTNHPAPAEDTSDVKVWMYYLDVHDDAYWVGAGAGIWMTPWGLSPLDPNNTTFLVTDDSSTVIFTNMPYGTYNFIGRFETPISPIGTAWDCSANRVIVDQPLEEVTIVCVARFVLGLPFIREPWQ